MLEPKLIEDLHKGTLNLDCVSMFLEPHESNPGHTSYSGPGCIRQDEKGCLCFKIYTQEILDKPEDPFRTGISTRGKLIAEKWYYRLSATDYRGRQWTSAPFDAILPKAEHLVPGQPLVVSGDLLEIRRSEDLPYGIANTLTEITVYDTFQFPVTAVSQSIQTDNGDTVRDLRFLDHAAFCLGEHEVTMEETCGIIHISVNSPPEVSCEQLERRIGECLQFVFARSLDIATTSKQTGSIDLHRVISRPDDRKPKHVPPPTQYSHTRGHETIYVLADKYFRFIQNYAEPKWHPISVYSYALIESYAFSVDARSLGVGVAVEGLLRTAFPNHADVSDEERDAVEKARNAVDKISDISPSLKERISGAIGRILSKSARGMLKQLAAEAKVHPRHIKAWEDLRHKSAHGRRPLSLVSQSELDLIASATVLFNTLVFAAVGYEGPFTDYSQRGWPKMMYPDAVRETQGESAPPAEEKQAQEQLRERSQE